MGLLVPRLPILIHIKRIKDDLRIAALQNEAYLTEVLIHTPLDRFGETGKFSGIFFTTNPIHAVPKIKTARRPFNACRQVPVALRARALPA
jgi:hypothetical protein